jgi:hypothetical protein
MTYLYLTKRNVQTIGGILQARNPFEALFNARREAFVRGADIKSVLMTKL